MIHLKSCSLFSGFPVKKFLQHINFEPETIDEKIAMGLVYGSNSNSKLARQQSYLTNSTPQEQQIRFALKSRVDRQLAKLGVAAAEKFGENANELHVTLISSDYLSVEFFKHIPRLKISIVPNSEESIDDIRKGDGSREMIFAYLKDPARHFNQILEIARERIYASDYGTALQILNCIPANLRNEDVFYMMGLCTNFFGRFEESEMHFRQSMNNPNPSAKIRAAYVISMLYLRMYPREKQSVKVAEELLNDAYEILEQNSNLKDWTFNRVFNRNGYALCLFRHGRVQEALHLLEWGIKELRLGRGESVGSNLLHQSVLMYNAIQCLRALGRYEECKATCRELIELDPLFPEYHLESARTDLEQGQFELALASLKTAESLDSFIPETYALQGFAYLQMESIDKAAQAYRKALALNPRDVRRMLDLGYCLSELGDSGSQELDSLLNQTQFLDLTEDMKEGFKALREAM